MKLKNSSIPAIYLASQSPRRRDLLRSAGLAPIVIAPDSDQDPEQLERTLPGEVPLAYVKRVANAKLQQALLQLNRLSPQRRPRPADLIIAADTVVALDGESLGKPANRSQAGKMLARLSDKTHEVITSVSISRFDVRDSGEVTVRSEVTFAPLSQAWIKAYVDSKEPMDKAGGYGIQGAAGSLIPRISGSYSGIMGLPLHETLLLIQRLSRKR
ncbi:MAG: septum formation protein Maf [Betaproteobacteria bacterium]|nr:septum formation protein Maf [Betaproteobacteria bacterium]